MIRLASYNVRKCLGTDRRRDPERVLRVIDRLGADIVALQEADRRLGQRPTALPRERIHRHLDMAPVPVPARPAHENGLGHHGNALLARPGLDRRDARAIDLPGLEPRGAILATFDTAEGPLGVIGAHLGLMRRDRRAQIAALCEIAAAEPHPVVILGDFNEWRESPDALPLPEGFAWIRPGRSFHSRLRLAALDGAILGPGLGAVRWGVHHDRTAQLASDHLPVWLDVERLDAPPAAADRPRHAHRLTP